MRPRPAHAAGLVVAIRLPPTRLLRPRLAAPALLQRRTGTGALHVAGRGGTRVADCLGWYPLRQDAAKHTQLDQDIADYSTVTRIFFFRDILGHFGTFEMFHRVGALPAAEDYDPVCECQVSSTRGGGKSDVVRPFEPYRVGFCPSGRARKPDQLSFVKPNDIFVG